MARKRVAVHVSGIVQGVGFRPFIYNLALSHDLGGWVYNSSDGVFIEVEGEGSEVDSFVREIETKAPPQARIEDINVSGRKPLGEINFEIRASLVEADKFQPVSPDIATCDECLKELFDAKDRRFRYPFINCTNCGPRFTIIEQMPYDRPMTTMSAFTMCEKCQAEYDDPTDRRFHAQPNACPVCGPQVSLWQMADKPQTIDAQDPISETARLLKIGKIIAIKGLGGFHLACDATSEESVDRLRSRKRRFGKPLGLMVADLESAKQLAKVSEQEAAELTSSRRPIVLLRRLSDARVASGIAPGNNYLGIMLPYTPVHHLLLKAVGIPLVMTSGNLSEEPIAMENAEAFKRLGHIADYFLTHDREIYSRYDDSVVRIEKGRPMIIRRARGIAPEPLHLDFDARELLACGPELKNTFCLTRGRHAFVSQHIGDLENMETLQHFEKTVELYKELFNVKPEIIAYDLHPEYLSTKYAVKADAKTKIAVQHHHAHIAGCLAENRIDEKVIGITYDGTGYGTDGTLWGGEFLISDQREFDRIGHLSSVRLPGGSAAIDNPYRMALSYLHNSYGKNYLRPRGGFWDRVSEEEERIVIAQVEKGLNSPVTTSCGRLFDAVSALAGIRGSVDYEGQAAIEMEMLIEDGQIPYKYSIVTDASRKLVIDTNEIIKGVMEDLSAGADAKIVAGRFHMTVIEFTINMCEIIRERYGIGKTALSGGVWQNGWLWPRVIDALEARGFKVLNHIQLPPNDGCISFGQAIVANRLQSTL